MTDDELFEELDLDGDGRLSRDDIRQAVRWLGWHWHEAPFHALLDFLTISGPLERADFVSCMEQVSADPQGIYGQVLRRGAQAAGRSDSPASHPDDGAFFVRSGPWLERLIGQLGDLAGDRAADGFAQAMARLNLPCRQVRTEEAALLVIDPQRSFSVGEWMHSLGEAGEPETMPIRLAFDVCARLLEHLSRRAEVMFTRCPFPPSSYGWDERLEGIIAPGQHYFIKPGNSVLRPDTNGYREWVESLLGRGITTLVMGGCTLTSCLRVSAMETLAMFREKGVTVVADLSLCGARTSNYLPSVQFENMSPVESAIRQMADAGVAVAESVAWSG